MNTILVLMAACLAAAAAAAAQSAGPVEADGRLLITNLSTAPFPHPQRAKGHSYNGRTYSAEEHYSSNAVAIFIPRGYRPADSLDFVIHLHGWNNNIQTAPRQYRLCEQLAQSRRNAVLVMPQGPYNAPDSFAGKLEDTNGLKALLEDVVQVLRGQTLFQGKPLAIGKIILSCHSGGYRGTAAMLDRGGLTGHVSEVWLFDALYAQTDSFMRWVQSQPSGRLVNIYTEHGGTKAETGQMMAALRERNIAFTTCNEGELNPAVLHKRQPLFIYTTLGHNDVLHRHDTFRQLLESSALSRLHDASG